MASAARDTICALATAAGEGAIGVLRLSGPRAVAIVSELSAGATLRPRRARRITLVDPRTERSLDQVIACFFRAPRSYTGEDVVELSAHGGELNLQEILEQLLSLGARLAEPGEFTRRAFVNGKMDLVQAEAVAELISARGERGLRNARATLDGELGRRVRGLRDAGVSLLGDLEACIDFSEEVDGAVERERLREQLEALAHDVKALAESYTVGRRLGGVAVALVGEVNVGKSSLFNALLGSQRALVSAEEGTTRDYLEAELSWDGHGITLIDMAGSRAEGSMASLERAGYELAVQRLRKADAAIIVIDAERGSVGKRPIFDGLEVVVANKIDRVQKERREVRLVRLEGEMGQKVLGVSALTGTGLDGLRAAVVKALFGRADRGEAEETVAVTQRRQRLALGRAEAALAEAALAERRGLGAEFLAEHVRGALDALGEITGEAYDEAVLDHIFARFCIGK